MAKKITSYEGLFGNTIYRDEHGKKIGESHPGFFGGTNLYDAKGHKVGYSMPSLLGGENHYDNHGHKVGYSMPGLLDRVAKQSFIACDLLCHDRTSLVGWKRGVMERLRSRRKAFCQKRP